MMTQRQGNGAFGKPAHQRPIHCGYWGTLEGKAKLRIMKKVDNGQPLTRAENALLAGA